MIHNQLVPGQDGCDPRPARDLIDFHIRWREFRPLALRVLERSAMTPSEASTMRALIDLADRVRGEDFED